MDMLSKLKLTPYSLHIARETDIVFKDKAPSDHVLEQKANIARQLYLKPRDFEQFGMTRGCPKCDNYIKYNEWGTKPHSSACRQRITEELAKTQEGQ